MKLKAQNPEELLVIVNEIRQINFQLTSHTENLRQVQNQLQNLQEGVDASRSLVTTVEERSQSLDQKLAELKSLTQRS